MVDEVETAARRARPAGTRSFMKTVPVLRRCEKLAWQAKPPAPPSLQTLGQQGRWGSRFRLPGRPEASFSQLLSLRLRVGQAGLPAFLVTVIGEGHWGTFRKN